MYYIIDQWERYFCGLHEGFCFSKHDAVEYSLERAYEVRYSLLEIVEHKVNFKIVAK